MASEQPVWERRGANIVPVLRAVHDIDRTDSAGQVTREPTLYGTVELTPEEMKCTMNCMVRWSARALPPEQKFSWRLIPATAGMVSIYYDKTISPGDALDRIEAYLRLLERKPYTNGHMTLDRVKIAQDVVNFLHTLSMRPKLQSILQEVMRREPDA